MINPPDIIANATTFSNSNTIKVIIVGIGVAGLTAAIECHRKGHSVTAFDRVEKVKEEGQPPSHTIDDTIKQSNEKPKFTNI
jgi:thioredoxin reductase